MKIGIMLGYAAGRIDLPVELIQEADRLGVHAVWAAEAYGSDAVTPLAWVGGLTERIKLGTAIMQMPGRTPANAAMTAMTLHQLSGGRFLMGLGLSGPQVVEGWHGVSFARPLTRTREYVDIVRTIFERKKRLAYDGRIYRLPYDGPDATGLGKPLKSNLKISGDIPIYLAAIGPKNVSLAAEIADGWLPIFFSPQRYNETYRPHVEAGLARASKGLTEDGKGLTEDGKGLTEDGKAKDFDIAPTVSVVMDDNLDVCYNALRPMLALYIGGMGARGRNFYYDLAVRYGYQEAADTIQDLYLDHKQFDAMAAVPEGLIDEVALVGPRERIQERLSLWMDSPVTSMNLTVANIETLRAIMEMVG